MINLHLYWLKYMYFLFIIYTSLEIDLWKTLITTKKE